MAEFVKVVSYAQGELNLFIGNQEYKFIVDDADRIHFLELLRYNQGKALAYLKKKALRFEKIT